jgi:hypothetical protein
LKLDKERPGLFSYLIRKAVGIDPHRRIYITREALDEAKRSWTPGEKHPLLADPPKPVPRKRWPDWAHKIAERASDDDKGVGDTVAREIGGPASEAFKAWYFALFGRTCGCEQRQAQWNAIFSYERAG